MSIPTSAALVNPSGYWIADAAGISDGSSIANLVDSSGNGWTASPSNASFKPVYRAAGFGPANRGYIDFNSGTNPTLETAAGIFASFAAGSSGYTVTVVAMPSGNDRLMNSEPSGNGRFGMLLDAPSATWGVNFGGRVTDPAISSGLPIVATMRFVPDTINNGTGTTYLYINGRLENTVAGDGGALNDFYGFRPLILGGFGSNALSFGAPVGTIAVYNSALSDSDRGTAESALLAYYGLRANRAYPPALALSASPSLFNNYETSIGSPDSVTLNCSTAHWTTSAPSLSATGGTLSGLAVVSDTQITVNVAWVSDAVTITDATTSHSVLIRKIGDIDWISSDGASVHVGLTTPPSDESGLYYQWITGDTTPNPGNYIPCITQYAGTTFSNDTTKTLIANPPDDNLRWYRLQVTDDYSILTAGHYSTTFTSTSSVVAPLGATRALMVAPTQPTAAQAGSPLSGHQILLGWTGDSTVELFRDQVDTGSDNYNNAPIALAVALRKITGVVQNHVINAGLGGATTYDWRKDTPAITDVNDPNYDQGHTLSALDRTVNHYTGLVNAISSAVSATGGNPDVFIMLGMIGTNDLNGVVTASTALSNFSDTLTNLQTDLGAITGIGTVRFFVQDPLYRINSGVFQGHMAAFIAGLQTIATTSGPNVHVGAGYVLQQYFTQGGPWFNRLQNDGFHGTHPQASAIGTGAIAQYALQAILPYLPPGTAPLTNPVFSPASGATVTVGNPIAATTTDSGAVVRYTFATDGTAPSDPDSSSAVVPDGGIITDTIGPLHIKALATQSQHTPSAIVSAGYTIEGEGMTISALAAQIYGVDSSLVTSDDQALLLLRKSGLKTRYSYADNPAITTIVTLNETSFTGGQSVSATLLSQSTLLLNITDFGGNTPPLNGEIYARLTLGKNAINIGVSKDIGLSNAHVVMPSPKLLFGAGAYTLQLMRKRSGLADTLFGGAVTVNLT